MRVFCTLCRTHIFACLWPVCVGMRKLVGLGMREAVGRAINANNLCLERQKDVVGCRYYYHGATIDMIDNGISIPETRQNKTPKFVLRD